MSFDFFISAVAIGKRKRVPDSQKIDILGRYIENAPTYFGEYSADDIEFPGDEYVEISGDGFFNENDDDGIMFVSRGGFPKSFFKMLFDLCNEAGYCVEIPDERLHIGLPPSLEPEDVPRDIADEYELPVVYAKFNSPQELEHIVGLSHSKWLKFVGLGHSKWLKFAKRIWRFWRK